MAKYYIVRKTTRSLFSTEQSENQDDLSSELVSRPLCWPVKVLIILILLIFLWTYGFVVYSFRDRDLLSLYSSSQLLKSELNQQLLQAVVEIEVSRQDGKQVKGTGFNIAPTGQIITNYHVLENARRVWVQFPDKKLYNGINWQGKSDYDLALIHLNSSDLPCVPVSTSLPSPGEKVIIIGNPLHWKQIAVEGIVGRSYQFADHAGKVMSIQASIYQGNSGSPVYNNQGQVVAVVFATLDQSTEKEKQIIGLAVPISYFEQEFQ